MELSSSTHEALGWDSMQVISLEYLNSIVSACLDVLKQFKLFIAAI
jgi:hypothetical protein